MENPKTCPFCEGKPEFWFWLDNNDKWAYARVSCSKCCAKIEKRMPFVACGNVNPGHSFIEVQEEAVKAWNRRVE